MKYIIIIVVLLSAFSCKTKNELAEVQEKLNQVNAELVKSASLIDSLQEENVILKNKVELWLNEDYGDFKLKRNPFTTSRFDYVETALKEHQNLIPAKGSFGGSMMFSRFQFLSSKWIIADYEDGHNMGRALLELTDNKDGLKLKLLSSIEQE